MAKVFEKINLGNITGYVVGAAGIAGWRIERTGKKRAIREKGKYQKIAERNDLYRSSSGLTDSGDTPRRDV